MTNRLYRDKSRAVVAGVCAGLSDYFGVHPGLLRLLFVLWALSAGTGVAVYILLWIFLPESSALGAGEESIRRNVSELRDEVETWGRDIQGTFGGGGTAAPGASRRLVLLGGLVTLLGLILLADSLHLLGWFRLSQLWPLVLILAGFLMLNKALRR